MSSRNLLIAFVFVLFLFAQTARSENPQGPRFKDTPTRLTATVGTDYSQDLKALLVDPTMSNIRFEMSSDKPSWLFLDLVNWRIYGNPAQAGVSQFRLSVFVKGDEGEVGDINHPTILTVYAPPSWKKVPLDLGQQPTEKLFSFDLNSQVSNPSGGALVFSFSGNKPQWLGFDSTGLMSGTPHLPDISKYQFSVTVTSSLSHLWATVDVVGEVINSLKPPSWTVNPIQLPDALEDSLYQQDVSVYTKNPQGGPLKFELLNNPPAWISISDSGKLIGTPKKADVGPVSLTAHLSSLVDGQLLDGGNTQITFKVVHVNHPPKWKEPVKFSVSEDDLMQRDLIPFVTDSDGDSISFSRVSGPAWVSVSAVGMLSGTPPAANVGDNLITVRANDGNGGMADTVVTVTVNHRNHSPYWTMNPIVLPDAPVDKSYVQKVDSYAKDPDGDKITFSKQSGPDWVSVTTSGVIIGLPTATDAGPTAVVIRATDSPYGAFADVQVNINVPLKINHPPKWVKDPIPLGDIEVGSFFVFDFSKFALDEDQDALTFKMSVGPSWLFMSSSGSASGRPSEANIGQFYALVEASDGQAVTTVAAFGNVIKKSDPGPVITPNSLVFTVKERETFSDNLNNPKYVTDPNGRPLTFSLVEVVNWIVLTSDGKLSISPLFKNIGDHRFTLKVVNDKGYSAQGPMIVHVIRNPRPPVWKQNPILFSAIVNKNFVAPVADRVVDLDGLSLSFSKVNGPDWLSVSSSGMLSGVPKSENVGQNYFTVRASNDVMSADVLVIISVTSGGPSS